MPQPVGAREGVPAGSPACGPDLKGFLWGQLDGHGRDPGTLGLYAMAGRFAAPARVFYIPN